MRVFEVCDNLFTKILFSFMPAGLQCALTLYPFVFYRYPPILSDRIHEFSYILDIKQMGPVKFYFLWVKHAWKYGTENVFEYRANIAQFDPSTTDRICTLFPQLQKPLKEIK